MHAATVDAVDNTAGCATLLMHAWHKVHFFFRYHCTVRLGFVARPVIYMVTMETVNISNFASIKCKKIYQRMSQYFLVTNIVKQLINPNET